MYVKFKELAQNLTTFSVQLSLYNASHTLLEAGPERPTFTWERNCEKEFSYCALSIPLEDYNAGHKLKIRSDSWLVLTSIKQEYQYHGTFNGFEPEFLCEPICDDVYCFAIIQL